jgi:hypothetical protein
MPMLDILAIDAATVSGLCRGRPGEKPVFQTVRFDDADRLRCAASVIKWASRYLGETPAPDVAYIEKPMSFGAAAGKSNAAGLIRLNSIYDIIGGSILLKGVKVIGVDVQRVREVFLGDGKLKRVEAKRRAKLMCQMLGWEPKNGDEADAGAAFYYASCCEAPRAAAIVHPGLWAKVSSLTLAHELGVDG